RGRNERPSSGRFRTSASRIRSVRETFLLRRRTRNVARANITTGRSITSLPAIAADLQGVVRVRWENHKALVCLVGENIRRQPDIASRAFAAVSDMDVRVVCQGASDRTISFLVEEAVVEESVQRLHGVFFPVAEPSPDWGGISTAYCQAG